jgi:eukaryotic-like serine/threonine-protein kinase
MKAVGVIFLAMFTSIATTAGLYVAQQKWGHLLEPPKEAAPAPKPKKVVPNLMGLTEADAKSNLDALGLKLIVGGRTESPDAKEGTVVQQAPKAGESLAAEEAVSLTFAIALPKVPDVVGKTVDDASQALVKAGYVVKVGDPIENEKLAPGHVMTQAPAAGGALKAKETVTIQASAGSGEVKVPKFVGLGMDAAKKEAEKSKLKLLVQWVDLPETATYVVLRQDPTPGKTVKPMSDVKVFVNH